MKVKIEIEKHKQAFKILKLIKRMQIRRYVTVEESNEMYNVDFALSEKLNRRADIQTEALNRLYKIYNERYAIRS